MSTPDGNVPQAFASTDLLALSFYKYLSTTSYAPDVEPGIRCGLASKIDVFPALMKLKDNKAETHI